MQRADTRQQILDTASVLFHSHSYSDVGVAAICDKAQVSRGSFFHFFKSKKELALAVMDQFVDQVEAGLVNKAFIPTRKPLERIECFVNELYLFQKAQTVSLGHMPGCPFGNLAIEQATQDEVLREKSDSCLSTLVDHLQAAVSEAVQTGALPEVDEKATAEAMLGYIEGIQLLAKARNNPDLISRLGPTVISIQVPIAS